MKQQQQSKRSRTVESIRCVHPVLNGSGVRMTNTVLARDVDGVFAAVSDDAPGYEVHVKGTVFFVPMSNVVEVRYKATGGN